MFAAENEHHDVVRWYLDELDRLARDALPGIPLDVVCQILGKANLPDTADLARLCGVSRANVRRGGENETSGGGT